MYVNVSCSHAMCFGPLSCPFSAKITTTYLFLLLSALRYFYPWAKFPNGTMLTSPTSYDLSKNSLSSTLLRSAVIPRRKHSRCSSVSSTSSHILRRQLAVISNIWKVIQTAQCSVITMESGLSIYLISTAFLFQHHQFGWY